MKTPLYNQKAETIGDVELNAKIFDVKSSLHLVTEAVRVQASNSRKGLAHTKTRGDVSGGGKKPWKQKGTGRARAGSNRSPIWRHGGVVFGPRSERNWSLKMNKKAKTKALFMSLSEKVKEGNLFVVDSITLDAPKTKAFVAVLKNFQDKVKLGKKQLFLFPKKDENLFRASRNLNAITPTLAASLNVTDILNADTIVMLKDSLAVIEKTYLKALSGKASAPKKELTGKAEAKPKVVKEKPAAAAK
jgi:large subunit ribosomal protein L4